MRRSIFFALAAAILAGLTITAVGLAGGSGRAETPRSALASFKHTGAQGGGSPHGQHLAGLAQRLGVTTRQLEEALRTTARRQLARAVTAGTITRAQRRSLVRCLDGHRRGRGRGCDARTLRSAARRLERTLLGADRATALPALKQSLAADLGAALGKSAGDVLKAARAELAERLEQGVMVGMVTERVRDLALGCFDDPGACDVAALKRRLGVAGG